MNRQLPFVYLPFVYLTSCMATLSPQSIIAGTLDGLFHCQIPHLVVYFTPVTMGVGSHELAKSDIILGNILPNIVRCCCHYNMNILPDFMRSMRVSPAVDTSIYPECLIPFLQCIHLFLLSWDPIGPPPPPLTNCIRFSSAKH